MLKHVEICFLWFVTILLYADLGAWFHLLLSCSMLRNSLQKTNRLVYRTVLFPGSKLVEYHEYRFLWHGSWFHMIVDWACFAYLCQQTNEFITWDSKSYHCKATDIFVYVSWYFSALTDSYFSHSVVSGILWWTQILLALNMFMFVSSNYYHDFSNYLHAFVGL